ncbi:hypothetical protein F5882DRAFT_423333 [Hyaloscypha sp. PMI_1271]|nr:hypothetical protein F5882DRAFT_423333 [Hyaloscypha sp. PMI_1271]
MYGRHVCILRILWVLFSFPLLFEFAAHPPHVVAPVLRARRLPFESAARAPHVFVPVLPSRRLPAHVDLLLEVAAASAQIPTPASKTFCRRRAVIELKMC